jgi:hypothetical protein
MEKKMPQKMKREIKDVERELISLMEKTFEMEHEITKVVMRN